MSRLQFRLPALLAALFLVVPLASAQVPIGLLPFGSYSGGSFETISNGSANIHLSIPIVSKPGRGMPFYYNLEYDSSIWYPVGVQGSQTWTAIPGFGWHGETDVFAGRAIYTMGLGTCPGTLKGQGYNYYTYSNWTYYDPSGASHWFPTLEVYDYSPCPDGPGNGPSSETATASDGSGLTLYVDNGPSATAYPPSGIALYPPLGTTGAAAYIYDTNGNSLSTSDGLHYYDTLGMEVLSISGSGTPSSPTVYKYWAAGDVAEQVTVNYTSFNIKTDFLCSGVPNEATYSNVNLVTEIDLPDSTKYEFTYEPTPSPSGYYTGRLKQITLPTGGTISYAYEGANDGVECSDGSTAQLQRTTAGSNVTTGVWTYTRSQVSGSEWKTTVMDPLNNQTVIYLQGPTNSPGSSSIYEVERQVYQGTSTLLETVDTCYNGSTVPCLTTSVTPPFSSENVQTTIANYSPAQTYTTLNSYSLPTQVDEYNWGGSGYTRRTVTAYASPGNYIYNRPSTISVCAPGGSASACNGSGTVVSQRSFTYDAAGNTKTASVTGQNMGTLTQSYSYGSYGLLSSVTDVNNAVTSYSSYATCPGQNGSQNAFPATITLPVNSLATTTAWDCYAGVPSSFTDANGQVTSYVYADPFSRLTKTTDPAGAITNINYCGSGCSTGFWAESTLTFNNNASVYDFRTTLDALGRSQVSQRETGPSTGQYDSVETTYDAAGHSSTVTMPYRGGAGATDPTNGPVTTTYDALDRPTEISDSDGGYSTYSYNLNDVVKTIGTAPNDQNSTKSWQYQYDALGRLTSVCEITSVSGSGSCDQSTAATGFLTTYSYDVLNDVINITQNAQASQSQRQARNYQYDALGRIIQASDPESGATNYTYDTDSTCGTSYGDLVKKVDAVGTVICYAYDQLHRPTAQTQSSGPYSTAPRYYVYDNATVNGVIMGNAGGRLAEACTGGNAPPNACSGSMITNLGFAYSSRGEPTNTFTWTNQSGGWYHVCETYYQEAGLPKSLGLYDNADTNCTQAELIPPITYGADGEGRTSTISASVQNPVTGVTYNNASQITDVTYGSGDSDSFSYDSNTGRMKQYQFNVGSQNMQGNLTWNTNGTLQQLAITDPFNSADQQTCNYTYDDLARINTVNCGSGFSQNFNMGVLGNLTKTGTLSFTPSYNIFTNQITSVGGQNYTYDADGNLLSTGTGTGTNSYGYNGFGELNADTPSGGATVGINYDALGRAVMTNVNGGSYTEFVYAPDGSKLALMNGQTLSKARVRLPGGGTAIYNSTGLIRYWHSDWEGSIRLLTNPSQPTYYSSAAAAPYGESYAENPAGAGALFAGLLGDTSSELNDALFREYNPVQGRWMSPDPAGLAAVDLTNPQSLNRYAYVMNNPTTLVDPLGLCNWKQLAKGIGQCAIGVGVIALGGALEPFSGGTSTLAILGGGSLFGTGLINIYGGITDDSSAGAVADAYGALSNPAGALTAVVTHNLIYGEIAADAYDDTMTFGEVVALPLTDNEDLGSTILDIINTVPGIVSDDGGDQSGDSGSVGGGDGSGDPGSADGGDGGGDAGDGGGGEDCTDQPDCSGPAAQFRRAFGHLRPGSYSPPGAARFGRMRRRRVLSGWPYARPWR